MLCENCKKNNATFHYRHSENGKITEAHLCHECAKKQGLLAQSVLDSEGFFGNGFDIPEKFGMGTFSSLFAESPKKLVAESSVRICPGCGMSENELRKYGKPGCRECYGIFFDIVEKMLRKLHMSTEYKGKIPDGVSESISCARKIEKMKAEMQKAVEEQNYEQAAKLRDAIKQLEEAGNTSDKSAE